MEFLNKRTESKRNWINKYLIFFAGMSYLLVILIFLIPNFSQLNDSVIGSSDAVQVYAEQISNVNDFNDFTGTERYDYFIQKFYSLKIFSFQTHLTLLGVTFGPELGFNIYWIFSFILAGMGMFLLVKKLIKSNSAAFIAGLIFAFSPTHFAYAQGYGGATHIEWIPFFVYFLIKLFEKYKISDFILGGVFYLFIYVNEPHFTLYISIFALLFVIYKIFKNPQILKNRRFQTFLIISTILLLIAIGSQYYKRSGVTLTADLGQVIEFSNDSLSIVTPPVFHRIWGDYFSPYVNSNYTGNSAENTIYLGLITAFLILLAVIKRKKIKDFYFWFFGGLFFFILSLGPFIHFEGLIKPMIPSVYFIFYEYFPGFENIRSVGRIFIVSSLCFSILAGWGFYFILPWLKNLFRMISPKFLVVYIMVLFSSLIIFDYLPEIQTSKIEISEFYHELNGELGDFAILQPLITTSYKFASEVRVYSTVHDKESFGGEYFNNFVRKDAEKNKHKTETPVINNLLYSLPLGLEYTDIIDYDYSTIANYYLNSNNIKYIILHKDYIIEGDNNREANYFRQSDFDDLVLFIETNVYSDKIINDNELIVYEVRQENQQPVIITVGENTYPDWKGNYWWENEKNYNSQPGRWFGNDSSLMINNTSQEIKRLELNIEQISSEDEVRFVEAYLNDELIKSFSVLSDNLYGQKIFIDDIYPGESILKFEVKDKDGVLLELDNKSKKDGILISGVSYDEDFILHNDDILLSGHLEVPSQQFENIIQDNLAEWYLNFENIFNTKVYSENNITSISFDKNYFTEDNLLNLEKLFSENLSIKGRVVDDAVNLTYLVNDNVIYQCLKDNDAEVIVLNNIIDWYKFSFYQKGESIFSQDEKITVLEQRFSVCYSDFEINGIITPTEWTGGEIRFYLEGLGISLKMYNGNELVLKIDEIEETILHKLSIGNLVNIKFIRRGESLQFYENNDLIFEKQIEGEKDLEKFKFSLVPYPEKEISLKLGEFSIKPIYE